MVVRLTRARRATSSRATRRKPCCSNSTTAASRMASSVRSAPGIALLRIAVEAHSHGQMIPHPVHGLRAPEGGEVLIATLLALTPRQTQHVAGAGRHAAGRQ